MAGQTIDKLIVEIGAENKDIKKKLGELEKDLKKTNSTVKGFSGTLNNLAQGIVAAFSVGAVINFGKQVIEVTSQFQRLEAVLGNTLGSQEASAKAFSDIKKFAAQTNFSVLELTDAYVKLTNQNMQPSMEQLRKMADVANSTGKSFDQLTEAVIDASTGQFERLKEFGILAQKNGDKVAFSFKGVKTEVDFTGNAIQDYIVGLGDLEGVSGATAKISETLGGRISNLGDSFDNLFATIGNASDGVLATFITQIGKAVDGFATLVSDDNLAFFDKVMIAANPAIAAVYDFNKGLEKTVKNSGNVKELQNNISTALGELKKKLDSGGISLDGYAYGVQKIKAVGEETFKSLTAAVKENNKTTDKSIINAEKLKNLQKNLKDDAIDSPIDPSSFSVNEASNPFAGMADDLGDVSSKLDEDMFADYLAGLEKAKIKTDELREKTQTLAGGFASGFSAIGGAVVQGLGQVNSAMGQFGAAIASLFTDLIAQSLSVSLANAITGATGAAAVAGPFAPAVLPATIATMTAGVLSAFASIPKFADGGLAFGASIGMVGEGRGTSLTNPEVIAPLDKLKQFINPSGGAGGNVTFRIEGRELVGILNRENKFNKY